MKKWVIPYLATMKLNRKSLKELVTKLVKSYVLVEAEEANPFAAKEEEPAADAAAAAPATPPATPPAAGATPPATPPAAGATPPAADAATAPKSDLDISFNAASAKKYNPNAKFLSSKGVVKSVSKKGVIVTTKPDDVDVLVNFNDISENVKRFFKSKK